MKQYLVLTFLLLLFNFSISLAKADSQSIHIQPEKIIFKNGQIIDMGQILYSPDSVIDMGTIEYLPNPIIDMGAINYTPDPEIDMGQIIYAPESVIDMGTIEYIGQNYSLVETESLTDAVQQMKQPTLLAPVGKLVFRRTNPIAFKFKHDVRQTDFAYHIEKWDNRRQEWKKTEETKLISTKTSGGEKRVVTRSNVMLRTPGKYRWTLVGYDSLGPMVFELITRKSIHQSKGVIRVKKAPSIWIDDCKPKATPKLGKPLNLEIDLKNIGKAKNDSTHKVTIKINCTLIGGGKCKNVVLSRTVPTINPGSKKTMPIQKALHVVRGGRYKVAITLDPQPEATSNIVSPNLKKSCNFTFKVANATQKTKTKSSEPSTPSHPGSGRPQTGTPGAGGSSSRRLGPAGRTPQRGF